MAVAGINNVSVLESSYLDENYSSVSRRWGNQERPITRTSFIRKMWRDLEGESRFRETESHQTSGLAIGNMRNLCSCSAGGDESEDASTNANEVENECPRDQNQMGIRIGQEDIGNLCLQRSPAFGVAEKQRVRQVFREWGSKSCNGRTWNVSHKNNCSRAQWLCENECKRVRTVRHWIELNAHQAETGNSSIEEQGTEIGSQTRRVREGLGGTHTGVGARRSICRLYGRQALLDLLTRFERERKRELQSLLENGPVSNFAHRNRIQALLRGRFLWNQRFVKDEKATSVASSELGLLRQTHTVSDLRKGFLSKLDNYEHIPDGLQSDTSSDNGIKYHQDNFQELPDDIADEFESSNTICDASQTHTVDWETDTCQSPREYAAPVVERPGRILDEEERHQLPSTELVETRDHDQDQGHDHEGSVEMNQGAHHIEPCQQTLELESTTKGPLPSPSTMLHSQYQCDGEELEVHEEFDHLDPSETNTDSLSWQEASAEAAEENGSEWNHLTNMETNEGLDANSIENEDEWYQESQDGWYDNSVEDTTESWFGTTLYQEAPLVARTETLYNSDDDNGNRLELRELMSRRRVSNLLQSDFRVRLDQLIQSYVERQDQASESDDEWMLEREKQDQDEQSVNEDDDNATEAVEGMEGSHSSLPVIPQTEWEIINGLRVDMARLQDRMNSMQRTLETCMNMQAELQRSVQQEVLSALNRSSSPGKDNLQKDEPKWKDGVCFLCCDSGLDSSPDWCGHVYICSKCAEKIDWSKLKESVRHP